MVAPISIFRRWYTVLVFLSHWAMVGHAAADPARQRVFQTPSSFEESREDASERYIWRNPDGQVSLKAGGRLSIRESSGREVDIGFLGANGSSEPRGEFPSEIKTLYYVGSPQDWRTASHFERVRYPAIYPGIDLVFLVTGGQLEYTFEIPPYANPHAIRMLLDRTSGRLTPDGDLQLDAAGSTITQRRPVAYQNVGGVVHRIPCRYRLRGRTVRGREKHLHVRHRCVGVRERVAAARNMDRKRPTNPG